MAVASDRGMGLATSPLCIRFTRAMTGRRVLFFAEAVTLAHVGRPIALARALVDAGYEVQFACDSRARRFVANESVEALPLHSIDSERFLGALASGRPVYDLATLRSYAEEDRRLIDASKPDLIVGDFRLSLSASARRANVPYATISNGYWSPFSVDQDFPLPVLPISQVLPLVAARALFRWARPIAFPMHCRPLNELRREHGLPSLGNDLRRIYTDADHTLYADTPRLFPTAGGPPNHHHLGPILWSPPVPDPPWWDDLPTHRPIVYLTLGSSGHARTLSLTLDALADLPVTVMAASAGADMASRRYANVHSAEYLPGLKAAARADLVICNGGSPTSQQALAASVPVLGLARNMDQFLNMQAVATAGAGTLLRADRLNVRVLREHISRMIKDDAMARAAAALSADLQRHHAPTTFLAFVDTVLGPR